MNKKIFLIITVIALLIGGYFLFTSNKSEGGLNLNNPTFFYGFSCPHCKNVEEYLEKNDVETKLGFQIDKRETYLNKSNADLFDQVSNDLDIPFSQRGVPMLIWKDDYIVGDSPIIDYFNNKIENADSNTNTNINTNAATDKEKKVYNLPFVGEVDLMKYSLPVLTLVIAAVDGFNPCAMWVLMLLIGALLGMRRKKFMWAFGLTFIGASALVYFLFLSAWLNLFIFIGYIRWVQVVIGLLALGVGIYYLREYRLNHAEECKVVEGERRKKITDRINAIVESKKILYAVGGLIALAFIVNLIELACSVGLPAIYTQILTLSDVTTWQYYLYILFYIIIFMLDDMIIFTIAMVTVQATGLTGKYSRFSELIGGIVIILLGLILILRPQLLMFA